MILELNPLKWWSWKPDSRVRLVEAMLGELQVQQQDVDVSTTVKTEESGMSTAVVVPAVKQTFLQHVGAFLKNFLHIGVEVATVAEPIVDAEFPSVAPLYNSAIGLAVAEEATASSATGTGAQKLASVVTKGFPEAEAFFTQNGIAIDQATYQKWVSAVVDTLNLLPGPAAAGTATATKTASATS